MFGSTPSRSRERVGKKNRRIQFAKATETAADAQVTYAPQGNPVWASFEERGGADPAGVVAESAAVFVVWYRTDVTVGWCIEMDSRRFEIDSLSDVDGEKFELELVTHEIKQVSP